jgi:CubicO group peptidase (beta-lactamase class C family)
VGPSRRTALLAGLGLASAAPAAARAAASAGAWADVDAVAGRLVAERLTPGLQLAVMRGDRFVYSKGTGLANLETGTPMSPTSSLRIGSASKPFMVAALLRLQEQGALSVDDRLSRFLPEVPRSGEITLYQLLTHTSGLGDYTHTDPPERLLQQSRLDYDSAGLLKVVLDNKPLFIGEPGAQYVYSNSAYVLLGMVMEKAAGRPFGEVVRALAIAPLGLERSRLDNAADVVPGRASGYSPDDKAASGFQNASYLSISFAAAAGGMRSTCEEFCRWDAALHAGRIISPASLKAMLTPVRLPNGETPTERSGPPLAPPTPSPYGLGVYVDKDEHGRLISHRGGLQGFITFAASYPDAGVRYAFCANADSGAKLGEGFLDLRQAILKAAF